MKKPNWVLITGIAALILSVLILIGTGTRDEADPPKTESEENTALTIRILELEARLSDILREQAEDELERRDEIASLYKEIAALRNYLYSTDEEPSNSDEKLTYAGYVYEKADEEITIIGYEGDSERLILPASIDGIPVTSIGEGAFRESDLLSVTLPDTVTSIGWFAFCESDKLERIILTGSITEIGYEAFSGCALLTIYAPSGSYAAKYAKSYGIPITVE